MGNTVRDLNKRYRKELARQVEEILESGGDLQAFGRWLHNHYLTGLKGKQLASFDAFMKSSALALDMIADWQTDCSNAASRVELLDHVLNFYSAEDFDEPEHFNEKGEPISYDEPGFDEHGKPIPAHVLWRRWAVDEIVLRGADPRKLIGHRPEVDQITVVNRAQEELRLIKERAGSEDHRDDGP
jgi:hypothetical protein